MPVENPIITAFGRAQHTSWKHLIDKKKYQLEFILPWKCIVQEYRNDGGYMTIASEVLEDGDLTVMGMTKGELIVVDIPVKTFSRAWYALPRSFKDSFTEECNLKVTFIKQSQKDIKFEQLERRVPTNEHIDFSKTVYDNPRAYVAKEFEVKQ